MSADQDAAAAVVRHHAQLAADLERRIAAVLDAAERGLSEEEAQRARHDLLAWLHHELMPHAQAEEQTLYPAAAADPAATALVTGMTKEHVAIGALVGEVERASSPVRAAAAARALGALFAVHLEKENELILPMLVDRPDVSVAKLLAGMHELLGAESGHDHGGERHGGGRAGNEGSGCAGDGSCGCGGDGGGSTAEAEILTIDPRLDVREIPHARRHAAVLAALESTPPGGALVLVAPHAPRPLLAEVAQRFGDQFTVDWLQEGPEV